MTTIINRNIDRPFDEGYEPKEYDGDTFYAVRLKRRIDSFCCEACVVAAGHKMGAGAPLKISDMESELKAVYNTKAGVRRRIPKRARFCAREGCPRQTKGIKNVDDPGPDSRA